MTQPYLLKTSWNVLSISWNISGHNISWEIYNTTNKGGEGKMGRKMGIFVCVPLVLGPTDPGYSGCVDCRHIMNDAAVICITLSKTRTCFFFAAFLNTRLLCIAYVDQQKVSFATTATVRLWSAKRHNSRSETRLWRWSCVVRRTRDVVARQLNTAAKLEDRRRSGLCSASQYHTAHDAIVS